jgi:hypothetical protein
VDPGDGEDRIVVGGGQQKIGEAVSDRKKKMEKNPTSEREKREKKLPEEKRMKI